MTSDIRTPPISEVPDAPDAVAAFAAPDAPATPQAAAGSGAPMAPAASSSAQPSLLLDTSIWLDNYFGDRPCAGESRALIDFAIEQGIPLLFAAASAKDVYYLSMLALQRRAQCEGAALDEAAEQAARHFAWACVRNMQEIATPVGIDQADIWLAMKYRGLHDDFEDDLVLAAAARVQNAYLVTADARLRRNAPAKALDAAGMLALLRAGAA